MDILNMECLNDDLLTLDTSHVTCCFPFPGSELQWKDSTALSVCTVMRNGRTPSGFHHTEKVGLYAFTS